MTHYINQFENIFIVTTMCFMLKINNVIMLKIDDVKQVY